MKLRLKKKVIRMLKEAFSAIQVGEDDLLYPDRNREMDSQLFLNVLIDWNRKPRVQNHIPLRYFYYLFDEKREIITFIPLNFKEDNITVSDVLKIMEDKNIHATTPQFTAISYSKNMEYERIAFLRLYGQVIYMREM